MVIQPSISIGEEYRNLIPGSQPIIFDKTGHFLPWERAEYEAHAIHTFCTGKMGIRVVMKKD